MQIQYLWRKTRSLVLLPVFKGLVIMCLVLSIIVFFESFYMNIVIFFGKLLRRKPEKLYKWEAMQEDVEAGSENYPKVLVQIPMYNEKEVFQISIAAVCSLLWPSSRLVIQVVDDSTDPVVREGVDIEIAKWQSQGINIRCERRDNRNGYKAGAMKEALTHNYVKQCDFVAVFDADFQPDPDYLARTIPFLVHNPDVALVQARWIFVNANKCLMTRMQEMSLNYHFKVEQESGFTRHAFFGFNGTAGVWRISAMDAAGGWKSRTTVEDMDLAVRVGLHGWKFVYLNDLTVRNELPSKFKAYRFQQHRWSCGPANLFRKMTMEIIYNKVFFCHYASFDPHLTVTDWSRFIPSLV
ncbi:BnaC07g33890D [Brassica napus]|uniref:glucomannan 4-beta-mannosyltransferase n=1 Tax=Brassica napus TaxID=3708 RepID=A0A078F9D2_BRANA|nr:BnaC07g33890D [Brassica napus]